jgi:hypothetical protein
VQTAPPPQSLPRPLQLLFIELCDATSSTIALHPFAKGKHQLAGPVDLALRERRYYPWRGSTAGGHRWVVADLRIAVFLTFCKAVYSGSIPVVASQQISKSRRYADCLTPQPDAST